MSKVTPIRKSGDGGDPRGRVDVLVAGIVEESCRMLIQPRSQELWEVLKPFVSVAAKKQLRKLGVPHKPLSEADLALIESILNPRRLKCTG